MGCGVNSRARHAMRASHQNSDQRQDGEEPTSVNEPACDVPSLFSHSLQLPWVLLNCTRENNIGNIAETVKASTRVRRRTLIVPLKPILALLEEQSFCLSCGKCHTLLTRCFCLFLFPGKCQASCCTQQQQHRIEGTFW